MNRESFNLSDPVKTILLISVFLLIIISGCIFIGAPTPPTINSPTRTFTIPIDKVSSTYAIITSTLVTLTPSETPSPTFTITISPTPTQTPTQVLPGFRFPETPVPVTRPIEYPAGQVKLLLLGSDFRGGNNFRTDSILVLTINPLQGTASILSIPPELYVNIPDVGMERINSAVTFGGAGKVMDTLQYNLGIRPDKFLSVDLNNFKIIIKFLETIDVYAAVPLTDRCDLPQAVGGWCKVKAGFNRMDENKTLWYVRSTLGGESRRLLRAQEVLLAVFSRLMTINAPSRLEEFYSTFQNSVETDLTVSDLHNLTAIAPLLTNPGRIRRYSFTTTEAVPFTLPGGENVFLLNQNAAWNLIQFAILEP
jgi:polyisoprenyl-teichoic acid--peptidoglycan teichoic acid transferase